MLEEGREAPESTSLKMEERGVVTLSFWFKIKEEDAAFLFLLPALKMEARICLKSPVTALTALSRPSSPELSKKIKIFHSTGK